MCSFSDDVKEQVSTTTQQRKSVDHLNSIPFSTHEQKFRCKTVDFLPSISIDKEPVQIETDINSMVRDVQGGCGEIRPVDLL